MMHLQLSSLAPLHSSLQQHPSSSSSLPSCVKDTTLLLTPSYTFTSYGLNAKRKRRLQSGRLYACTFQPFFSSVQRERGCTQCKGASLSFQTVDGRVQVCNEVMALRTSSSCVVLVCLRTGLTSLTLMIYE